MKVAWDADLGPDWPRLYGEFIKDWGPWHWWITLTFQRPVWPGLAKETFKSWARGLAQDALRDHVRLAWVLDTNGGHLHFHALMGLLGNTDTSALALKNSWIETAPGLTGVLVDIQEYDPNRPAAIYLGMKVNLCEWGMSTACSRRPACRRGKGCRVDNDAW